MLHDVYYSLASQAGQSEHQTHFARAQRNRLLAAFEGINAAEDDMEAVIARLIFTDSLSLMPSLSRNVHSCC